MGRAGQGIVAEQHSAERVADSLLLLYDGLVRTSG